VRAVWRDLWGAAGDAARGLVKITAGRSSWRESLRLMRASFWGWLGERTLGTIIFLVFAAALVMFCLGLWTVLREASRSSGVLP